MARFFKADDEQQIVFGIVLEPDLEDTQGVEQAAHRFAERYALGKAQLNLDHEVEMDREDAILVETFIAPEAFTQGSQLIRKGSWIIGVHIPDSAVWHSVKDSERTGFSIGGSGEREPAITKRDEPEPATAYAAIEAEAARLMKSDRNLTPEQAFARVYKSRADLRRRYEVEEVERKVRQLGG